MASEDEERRLWFRREVIPLEPMLRSYAARFCHGGSNDVEDLVQETFAKLIAYQGWSGIENVPAFALRTLKNLALKAARRNKIVSINVIADLDTLNVIDDRPSAERAVEARNELHTLARLISELPPQCRRVFTLRKVYGLSYEEIAVRLGLSISTVEKHVIKGLRLCSEGLAMEPKHGLRVRAPWTKAKKRGEVG